MIRKLLVTVVALAAFLATTEAAAQRRYFDPQKVYRAPLGDSPQLGRSDALVTIVEFSDFYCGYCRRANRVLRDLRTIYGDALRIVYVHSPLAPQDGTLAPEAALAAEAQGHA